MKPLALLAYVALAASASAQSVLTDRLSRTGGDIGGKTEAESVQVGNVLWQGVTYKDASAKLDSPDEIRPTSHEAGKRPASLTIPWDKAPLDLKTKLAKAHEAAVAADTPAPDYAAERLISSVVLEIIPEGIIVWIAPKQRGLLSGHPKQAQLADGDTVKAFGKRVSLYKYKNSLGHFVTLPAYQFLRLAP